MSAAETKEGDGAASDGFGGILFADENFQEAELGFDPLVLFVLLQHRHPVLLLNISTRREGERERRTLEKQHHIRIFTGKDPAKQRLTVQTQTVTNLPLC